MKMKLLTIHGMFALGVYKQRKFKDRSLLPVFPFRKGRSTNKEAGDLQIMSDKGKEWSQPLFGCFDDVTTCKLPCFML